MRPGSQHGKDTLVEPFSYYMPTRIVFRAGAIDDVAAYADTLGAKAFLVTGRHSSRTNGSLDKVLHQLPQAVVHDAIDENPTTDQCEDAAARCRESACDYVIGLGGGSPMDAAKAIAGLVVNGGRAAQYVGTDKFLRGSLPILAIPTTAGTGSEVTPYSVVVDPSENTKRTISGKVLFPALAIMDPELTVSMPRNVTIHTGLDALSQAMEGMLSRRATAVGDMMALEICRLVRKWLPTAADESDNLDARAAMMHAAMLSGCVIAQSGTTLVHGMGYYYTMEFGIAHGLANALLLPPIFAFNATQRPEKVAALADALGKTGRATPNDAADSIKSALRALMERLGVSVAARDHGADESRLEWCAQEVFRDRSRFKNQVGEPTLDELRGFFAQAQDGTW